MMVSFIIPFGSALFVFKILPPCSLSICNFPLASVSPQLLNKSGHIPCFLTRIVVFEVIFFLKTWQEKQVELLDLFGGVWVMADFYLASVV